MSIFKPDMILPSVHWQVAFRFGHSQVQNEFRPWINGQESRRRTDGQHAFWILANNFFEGSDNFVYNEQGKGWVNEVEGLINQKCPQADLRLENSLTNSLFGGSATGRDFVGGRKTITYIALPAFSTEKKNHEIDGAPIRRY